MKSIVNKISVMVMMVMMLTVFSVPVFAAETSAPVLGEPAVEVADKTENPTSSKAWAEAI